MAVDKKALMRSLYGEVDKVCDTSQQNVAGVRVQEVRLSMIDDYPDEGHPFAKSLRTENGIDDLAESIKLVGVLQPVILMPKEERFLCLAGHRRTRAAIRAGLSTIPAIIKTDLTPELVTLIITDTNLNNRKNLYPSEIASAYQMQLEVLKRQGYRTDLTENIDRLSGEFIENGSSSQTARDIIAERYKTSPTEISKYVRLKTKLMPELLERVDDAIISVRAGYILSFLSPEQQRKIIRGTIRNVSIEEANAIKGLPEEVWKKIDSYDDILEYLKNAKRKKQNPVGYSVTSAMSVVSKPYKKVALPSAEAEKELVDVINTAIDNFLKNLLNE